jgi:hypothetical protein
MRSLIAALALLPVLVAAADLVPVVPSQFVGEWNARVADCGTGDNDSALRIRNNQIEYYESDGPIKAVVSHGRYEIALIVELSGEGQTWITTEHFKLSPGEDKLTSVNQPGDGFVRYRCPSKRK